MELCGRWTTVEGTWNNVNWGKSEGKIKTGECLPENGKRVAEMGY